VPGESRPAAPAESGAEGEDGRDFPADFLWGSATAAHQVEGSNTDSDWWDWEQRAGSGVREASGVGIDHWRRYPDDFRLLAALGQNAHRLSIEWARLEPAPGEWRTDVVEHYRSVLGTLRDLGMTPLVTLHHFTSPRWFAAAGGFRAPDALERFRAYVSAAMRDLGDLTPFVCTVNEPQILALQGYLLGTFPPGERDLGMFAEVGRTLLAAHRVAVEEVRARRPDGVAAGLCLQLPAIEPARDDPACAQLAASLSAEFAGLYLDGLAPGTGRDQPADPGDFVGVQYYTRIRADPTAEGFLAPPPPDAELTQMGWEVYPDGLRTALHAAAGTGLPVIVTENGIATGDDARRLAYLESHLAALRQARAEGVDVRGYLYWSSFDNFEWAHGYEPTFGLVGIDRSDDLRRVVRPSAEAFGRVARTGRLEALRSYPPVP
jgi:beta-glucosidase